MAAPIDPLRSGTAGPEPASAIAVLGEAGIRLLIDSEALHQAVYVFLPVFAEDGSTIVDLEVVTVNEAARRMEFSEHIVVGARVSDVFIDLDLALDAATVAWNGGRPAPYRIERRGLHRGRPTVIRFDVATMRAGAHIVQVSADRTVIAQLASADARFRLMAEASTDGLLLLDPGADGRHVVAYANALALVYEHDVRVGEALPDAVEALVRDALADPGDAGPVRRLLRREVLTRRTAFEATIAAVGDDQVMLSLRELTSREVARAELDRSDRVLRAIGAGAFGTIAVYEPRFEDGELVDLNLLWSAAGQRDGRGAGPPIDPTLVLPPDELLRTAREMAAADESQRSGWVPVLDDDGEERSVEFTLGLAGDRFVLEFVERTEELAARTALAAVTATAAAQRSFLSRISHEMRSPLNVINGYTQLLDSLHLPEPAAEHVANIERGVRRMVAIVDDLLLLGQLDQGLVVIDEQPVGVARLVAEVLESAALQRWFEPDLLVGGPDGSDAVVRTDRVRFVAATVLLAEASVQVGDGEPIGVRPFVRGTRAGVQLVAPAGSAVVTTLWKPFVATTAIPGTGLAMAVARSRAAALDVSVESRRSDDGATAMLVLSLPVAS